MRAPGKRLRAAIALIDCDTLADVGCDHGKAGAEAVRTGRARRVIFSDISAKSLSKARDLAAILGIDGAADFRVGDGMTVLGRGEADCVLIAGMGGNEIMHILDDGIDKCDSYVLIAHRDVAALRQYLTRRGFALVTDAVVEEGGKFYNVLAAKRGEACVPEGAELLVGACKPVSEDTARYLQYLRGKYTAIAERATDEDSRRAAREMLDAVRDTEEKL